MPSSVPPPAPEDRALPQVPVVPVPERPDRVRPAPELRDHVPLPG